MELTNQKATSIEEEEEIILESLDNEESPREEKDKEEDAQKEDQLKVPPQSQKVGPSIEDWGKGIIQIVPTSLF